MASDLAGITLPSSYLPGTHPPSTDASATSLMGDNETKDSIQLATAALHNTGRNFNGSYGSGSFRPVVRDDAPSNVTYVYNQYGAFISHYHTGGTQSATTIPQQGELGIIDPELQASVPAIRYQVKADEQDLPTKLEKLQETMEQLRRDLSRVMRGMDQFFNTFLMKLEGEENAAEVGQQLSV